MKIFFISDIHGNEFALKSILEYAQEIKSDLIFCAGDISGYFVGTNEVINLLRAYNVQSILGNHDAFLLDLLPVDPNKSYYSAYAKTRRELSEESYTWLNSLPVTIEFPTNRGNLKIYHGGPNDPFNQYAFPDTLDLKSHDYENLGLFVFGHTHLQFVLQFENRVFINPGSVGLPRNGDFRAHGISYDSDKNLFTEHKISYDLNHLIESYISDAAVNPKFFHNINFGRSSNKTLKKRQGLFLDNDIVNILANIGITTINTSFGAILSLNVNFTTKNLLYIASYYDNTIEVTSNNLSFHWKNNLHIETSKFQGKKRFVSDRSGIYYYELFLDETNFRANMINNIKIAFNFIKNESYNDTK